VTFCEFSAVLDARMCGTILLRRFLRPAWCLLL